jgi:ElaB/YqjD/DUF883 family membrane-anchored ribosome-binding protein
MTQSTTASKPRKQNQGNDTGDAADVIEALKTRVEDAADDLKTRAEDVRDNVQEKASDALEKVRDQITASPIQAVAIAVGVGYFARILFRGPLATMLAIGAAGYLGVRLAK